MNRFAIILRVTLLGVALVSRLPSTALADGPAVVDLQKRLADEKAKFKAAKPGIDNQLKQDLDTTIHAAKSQRGDAATKLKIVQRLEGSAQEFRQSHTLPEDDEFVSAVFRYADRINKARKPVRAVFDQLSKEALQQNDTARMKKITDDKEEFDQGLGLRGQFVGGKHWHGTRFHGGNNDAISFNVGAFDGTTFDGHLHINRNVAGHPVLKIKGRLDGIKVLWDTVQVVEGKTRALSGEAYLVNKVMIGAVGGINTNGTAAGGLFVLR